MLNKEARDEFEAILDEVYQVAKGHLMRHPVVKDLVDGKMDKGAAADLLISSLNRTRPGADPESL